MRNSVVTYVFLTWNHLTMAFRQSTNIVPIYEILSLLESLLFSLFAFSGCVYTVTKTHHHFVTFPRTTGVEEPHLFLSTEEIQCEKNNRVALVIYTIGYLRREATTIITSSLPPPSFSAATFARAEADNLPLRRQKEILIQVRRLYRNKKHP